MRGFDEFLPFLACSILWSSTQEQREGRGVRTLELKKEVISDSKEVISDTARKQQVEGRVWTESLLRAVRHVYSSMYVWYACLKMRTSTHTPDGVSVLVRYTYTRQMESHFPNKLPTMLTANCKLPTPQFSNSCSVLDHATFLH